MADPIEPARRHAAHRPDPCRRTKALARDASVGPGAFLAGFLAGATLWVMTIAGLILFA